MDGKVGQIEDSSIESSHNLLIKTLGVSSHPLDVSLEKPGPEFPVSIQELESPGLSLGEGSLY